MSDSPIYDDMKNAENEPIYRGVIKPEPIIGPITGENDTVNQPSSKPQAKVVAATVGAGVGSATGEVLVWIIEASAGIDIPNNVEFAIGVILTAGLAFIGGYFKRNKTVD